MPFSTQVRREGNWETICSVSRNMTSDGWNRWWFIYFVNPFRHHSWSLVLAEQHSSAGWNWFNVSEWYSINFILAQFSTQAEADQLKGFFFFCCDGYAKCHPVLNNEKGKWGRIREWIWAREKWCDLMEREWLILGHRRAKWSNAFQCCEWIHCIGVSWWFIEWLCGNRPSIAKWDL